MMNGLVQHWMTSPVITISPDTSLSEARKIINQEHIRALPVMDGDRLVGIITRRGLLRLDVSFLSDVAANSNTILAEEKIGNVMTDNPITISPQALIPKAARIMLENKITALPVVEDDKLVGILTNSDIMRFIIAESPSLNKTIPIDHYMTNEVVTIEPDTSLLEAHRLMGVKRIRSLPVLKDNELIGIITRTDLMSSDPSRAMTQHSRDFSMKILTQPVEKLMTKELITTSPELPLTEAARLMLENKIHCLLVLDSEQQLIGIITESDLFLMVVQKFF
jgi:CBS domain-containing protein